MRPRREACAWRRSLIWASGKNPVNVRHVKTLRDTRPVGALASLTNTERPERLLLQQAAAFSGAPWALNRMACTHRGKLRTCPPRGRGGHGDVHHEAVGDPRLSTTRPWGTLVRSHANGGARCVSTTRPWGTLARSCANGCPRCVSTTRPWGTSPGPPRGRGGHRRSFGGDGRQGGCRSPRDTQVLRSSCIVTREATPRPSSIGCFVRGRGRGRGGAGETEAPLNATAAARTATAVKHDVPAGGVT